jgi:hypothetical protein
MVFDEDNRITGVEVEDAGRIVDLSRSELRALPVADPLFRQRVPAATWHYPDP